MYNAIYYHEMYLLLPEEFKSYDAFIHDLRLRNLPAQYPMIVLLENHRIPSYSVQKGMSMAPNFLSGYHDEPSMVTIENPEDVIPCFCENHGSGNIQRRTSGSYQSGLSGLSAI